jgi:P27 family predicted phage terminase small subunit
MAGRKKKPTQLKVLQGTFRADRANPNEPSPDSCIPDAPDHLSKDALIEWGRMSSHLYKLGLLSEIDRTALAIYCQTYSRMIKYEKIVSEKGELIKTSTGAIQLSPAMWVVNKAIEQCHKFLVEFGMSPASRAKVTAKDTDKEKDEWDAY